jgi:RNA polymerase-binding transcription factor DksA
MSANPNSRATDNAIDQSGGLVWNRLHSEREEICEALLNESVSDARTGATVPDAATRDANWHKTLLQARLRKIDDALDRLLSGSYGSCSRCGRWIEDTKLDFDPAIAFCIECWEREQNRNSKDRFTSSETQPTTPGRDSIDHSIAINPFLTGVALETLAPSDTICAQTLNSDYRIFLLDAGMGRALVEGGQFAEPAEAVVSGSTLGGSSFVDGWIGIGLRIVMWVGDQLLSTSPVQSIRVERHASVQPRMGAIPKLEM